MQGYSLHIEPIESAPDFFVLTTKSGSMESRTVIDRSGLDALPNLVRDAKARSAMLKREPG